MILHTNGFDNFQIADRAQNFYERGKMNVKGNRRKVKQQNGKYISNESSFLSSKKRFDFFRSTHYIQASICKIPLLRYIKGNH